MAHELHIGDDVTWDWGNGTGTGKVTERFTTKVTRTLSGTEVTRNASEDEPAYLIEQQDGDQVLKRSEHNPALEYAVQRANALLWLFAL